MVLGFGGMYIEGQQYGIYSLYIAPILVMTGFIIVAISIFRTDPNRKPDEESRKDATDNTTTAS